VDRYVVIGNPVAHSLSPRIHARFAAATGEAMAYDRLLVEPGEFMRATAAFFGAGGRGANVTLPFKIDAFAFAQQRSPRAEEAGAVNTLALREGRVFGDNTDGAGLLRDLVANLGVVLADRRVLILGAGGAARGVIAPLLQQAPAVLVVANRTRERAVELARRFAHAGPIEAAGLDEVEGNFDLVINATSGATRGESLPLAVARWLAPDALAYDMAYGQAAHPFLGQAGAAGARTSDGLGMLVEQAAESFYLWRGKRPDTAGVIAELRAR
jgi:shikimate dehydrogenase